MEKSKRQMQKELTKEKIINSAFEICSENGFAVSTDAIAKHAGVAHGTIFTHFPKADVLLSCLVRKFGDSIEKTLSDVSLSWGGIDEFLEFHVGILEEYEQFYSKLIAETTSLPKDAQSVIHNIQSSFESRFSEVITRGVEEKVIRRLPANILFNTWVGLLHYYMQNKERFAPGGSVLKRYKKQLIFTFCELIRRI